MEENKDFTVEDSEELMSNLASKTAPEFEKLRSTLNLLAHTNELSPTSTPPLLPSQIGQSVQLLTRKSTRSRRTIITSILSVGLLASASLAAAAVTGRGPAPIVNMAHESAKLVRAVAGAVSDAVTGNNSDSHTNSTRNKDGNGGGNVGGNNGGSGDGQSGNSEHSLTGPSSAPTPEEGNRKTGSGSNSGSNSGSTDESNTGSGEKNHSSNDGSRTPTAKPSQDQGSDQSSGDNSPSVDLNLSGAN